jgi:hypothetical protein
MASVLRISPLSLSGVVLGSDTKEEGEEGDGMPMPGEVVLLGE